MTTYGDAGVDLELSDLCSKIMYEASLETFQNRDCRFGEPVIQSGGFSGPIYVPELDDAFILKNSDGVGTKVEIAEKLGDHTTMAFDLIAMVVDDAAAMGAEAFAITDTLNVSELKLETIVQLAAGLTHAARRARIAVVGGEIAVLGNRINGEYVWDADGIAVLERSKQIDTSHIEPGDKIYALLEQGFRSNGFSLIRKILTKCFGEDWVNAPYHNELSWGEAVLTPSIIYTPIIVDAVGGYGEMPRVPIKGISHITGGGIPGNLARILPKGLGAHVDVEPIPPMLKLQELGEVPDEEAYRVWNMGAGMLLVCDDEEIVEIAEEYHVEAVEVGEVTDSKVITIKNNGFYKEKAELVYEV